MHFNKFTVFLFCSTVVSSAITVWLFIRQPVIGYAVAGVINCIMFIVSLFCFIIIAYLTKKHKIDDSKIDEFIYAETEDEDINIEEKRIINTVGISFAMLITSIISAFTMTIAYTVFTLGNLL